MRNKTDVVWTKQPGRRWIATVWREGERQMEEERLKDRMMVAKAIQNTLTYNPLQNNYFNPQINYQFNVNRCSCCGQLITQNPTSLLGFLGLGIGI